MNFYAPQKTEQKQNIIKGNKMPEKRLNIMLSSMQTNERITLPVNPKDIEIKYEKDFETYDILNYGKIFLMSNEKPLKTRLSFILPENDEIFNTNSNLVYQNLNGGILAEEEYSSNKAVEILIKWAKEQNKLRLLIDDELNIQCFISSFSQILRESTAIKPCVIELIEYKNPSNKTINTTGIYKRTPVTVPEIITMKSNDTLYSLANKYNLDFKLLAKNNAVKDPNANYIGKKLYTEGSIN